MESFSRKENHKIFHSIMGKKYPSSFDEMMIFLTLPLNTGWVSITGKRNLQEQSPQTPGFLKTGDQCITPSASPAFKQDFLPFLTPLPLKRGAGCCGGAGEPRLRRGRPWRRVPGCPTVSRAVPPCTPAPAGPAPGGLPPPPPALPGRLPLGLGPGLFRLPLPVSCQPGGDIPAGDLGDYISPEKRAVDHADCFRIPIKLRFLPVQGTGREREKEKRKAVIVPR